MTHSTLPTRDALRLLLALLHLGFLATPARAAFPPDYRGQPFTDAVHRTGVPSIPGVIQCALYDLGGEGVAYHDADAINHGSGELNQQPGHQRAHASAYLWNFRKDEGVDLSYVKDWADLNHTNLVSPPVNQLCIGWATNGEWVNYTVEVREPGLYRIRTLYSYQANAVSFDVDGEPAAACRVPVATQGWHYWNVATIGTIRFREPGRHLLTFHYGWGNNFATFEFERLDAEPTAQPPPPPPPPPTTSPAPARR